VAVILKAKFRWLKMFKKDTSTRHWCVICIWCSNQVGEIKANNSPFSYASIGAEQNFGGYAGK
jgi:AAA ATPase family protein